MEITIDIICESLSLSKDDIFNVYPYGSRVYGTDTEDSDYDFVIVYKRSLLPSGSFKDNAISSEDRTIQATCYSRGGFIDAINNFQISALECIYLPDELIIQKKFPFKIQKFDERALIKNIIKTASFIWYFAKLSYKDEDIERSKKNIFHALRILDFGIQIKQHGKILDYSKSNPLLKKINDDDEFYPKKYNDLFLNLTNLMKKI